MHLSTKLYVPATLSVKYTMPGNKKSHTNSSYRPQYFLQQPGTPVNILFTIFAWFHFKRKYTDTRELYNEPFNPPRWSNKALISCNIQNNLLKSSLYWRCEHHLGEVDWSEYSALMQSLPQKRDRGYQMTEFFWQAFRHACSSHKIFVMQHKHQKSLSITSANCKTFIARNARRACATHTAFLWMDAILWSAQR